MPTQPDPGPGGAGIGAHLERRLLPQTALLKIPRQARAVETVHTVLDAALRVLTEEGAETFNTNRIAAVAGVSPGSLYQYFANREMILAAMVERCALHAGSVVHRILATRSELPPDVALRTAVDTLAGEAEQHGAVLAEILRLAPLLAHGDLTAVLEVRLVDAVRGHLAVDPAALFVAVNACIFVLLKWAAERPPQVSRAALVDALASVLVDALRTGARAHPVLSAVLP